MFDYKCSKFMLLSTNYTLSLKVLQINYDWHTFKVAMFYDQMQLTHSQSFI